VECPFARGPSELSARDREWLDDQPRVAFVDEPRVRVEAVPEVRSEWIDVVQGSPHEYGPTLSPNRIELVDLERDLKSAALDDVAGTRAHSEEGQPNGFDKPVGDREYDRRIINDDGHTADAVVAKAAEAFLVGELFR
jgi:hypothetical protein